MRKKRKNGKVAKATCVKKDHNYQLRGPIKNHGRSSGIRYLALQNEVRLKAPKKKEKGLLVALKYSMFFTDEKKTNKYFLNTNISCGIIGKLYILKIEDKK